MNGLRRKEINLLDLAESNLRFVGIKMAWAMAISVVVGLIGVGLGQAWVGVQQERQASREAFLKSEIKVLDEKIKEIADIQERTNVLVGRKKVIERLQFNRGQAVVVLSELMQRMPEGVQLRQIEQTGETLRVVGWATSNTSISAFMKTLEGAPSMETPTLGEIKAVYADAKSTQKVQEFTFSVRVTNERQAKEKERAVKNG
jgi:type IV pilus assembly protein PilN